MPFKLIRYNWRMHSFGFGSFILEGLRMARLSLMTNVFNINCKLLLST